MVRNLGMSLDKKSNCHVRLSKSEILANNLMIIWSQMSNFFEWGLALDGHLNVKFKCVSVKYYNQMFLITRLNLQINFLIFSQRKAQILSVLLGLLRSKYCSHEQFFLFKTNAQVQTPAFVEQALNVIFSQKISILVTFCSKFL